MLKISGISYFENIPIFEKTIPDVRRDIINEGVAQIKALEYCLRTLGNSCYYYTNFSYTPESRKYSQIKDHSASSKKLLVNGGSGTVLFLIEENWIFEVVKLSQANGRTIFGLG